MMKKVRYRKQILALVAISLLSVILGILFLCQPDADLVCYGIHDDLSLTVWLLSAVFFITLIPLYFTKEAVYKAWRKFAIVYLPIAMILIAIGDTSGRGGGLGGPSMDMDREMTTFFFSGLFLFISFILILYKSLKLRGK